VHAREDKIDQEIVKRVEEVAKKHNVSMACIATAWSVKKGCCPIIGMNKKERIEEAVKNVAFRLSDEDAAYLEERYAPKVIQGY
jgi:aryl-alcohol dehydrogenase-like predicted oxidoreductase